MLATILIIMLLGLTAGVLVVKTLGDARELSSSMLTRLRAMLGSGTMADLQRAAAAEVKRLAIVSISARYLPNSVVVVLNPKDADRINGLAREFTEGVASIITAATKGRTPDGDLPYRLAGRLEVSLQTNTEVRPGCVEVIASNVAKTQLMPNPEPDQSQMPVAEQNGDLLELVVGEQRYPMAGRVRVGRDDKADVQLEDESVSREHAELFCRGMELILVDLNSTNGTAVNGESVTRSRLRVGDHISFGGDVDARVDLGSRARDLAVKATEPLGGSERRTPLAN